MDVRCTSTGKVFFKIDTQIAALLCEALPSVFEKVEQPAAAPAPTGKRLPVWVVNINQATDIPQIQLTLATGQNYVYPGPGANAYGNVEEATAAFATTGFPLPDDVAAKFGDAVAAAIARNQAKRGAYESGYRG